MADGGAQPDAVREVAGGRSHEELNEIDMPDEILLNRKALAALRDTCREAKITSDPDGILKSLRRIAVDLARALGLVTLARSQPFAVVSRKVAVKFGSGILSYYKLVQWTLMLNAVIAGFWIGFILVPWFQYHSQNDYKNINTNESLIDTEEILLNIIGTAKDEAATDSSFFFYSGYQELMPYSTGDYKMGQVYSVLVCGTFLFSVLLLIGKIGALLWGQAGRESGDCLLATSLYAWDWQVRDPEAVYEKVLGMWLTVQTEYYKSLCMHGLRIGMVVEGRESAGYEFCLCQLIGIEGELYKLQRKDGSVFFTSDPADDLRPHEVCGGYTRAQVRRIVSTALSLLLLAGALAAYYHVAKHKKALAQKFGYLPTIIIKCIALGIPAIQAKIVEFEEIEDPEALQIAVLWRVFLIRMAGVVLLVVSMYNAEKNDPDRCVELSLGRLFQQMLFVEYIIDPLLFLTKAKLMPAVLHKARRAQGPPPRIEFDVPNEVLNHLYRQVLVWIGCMYCPMVTCTALLLGVIFFFVKYKMMTTMNKTPSKPLAGGGDNMFFYVFLLGTWMVACFPLVLFMSRDKTCGAHKHTTCTSTPDLQGPEGLDFSNFTTAVDSVSDFFTDANNVNMTCNTPMDYLGDFARDTGIDHVTDWLFHPLVVVAISLVLGSSVYLLLVAVVSGHSAMDVRQKNTEMELESLRLLLRDASSETKQAQEYLQHIKDATLASIPPPVRPNSRGVDGRFNDHFADVTFAGENAIDHETVQRVLPNIPRECVAELIQYLDPTAVRDVARHLKKNDGDCLPGTVHESASSS